MDFADGHFSGDEYLHWIRKVLGPSCDFTINPAERYE